MSQNGREGAAIGIRLCAIISEYNPFHNGHGYHIDETRRLLGEDTVVAAVMSGDYTQRGEPAVFGTLSRAEAALEKADLVLELPLYAAVASAEAFARGGVEAAAAIGARYLSFGSESGRTEDLREIAACLLTEDFSSALGPELEKGVSFAAARQKAVQSLLGEKARLLATPNDILAIEYLKAIEQLGANITPIAVRRAGPGHDAPDEKGGFKSASALRAMLLAGEDISRYVPPGAMAVYRREIAAGRGPVSFALGERSLLYRLRTMDEAEYASLPYAAEGLHLKLRRAARDCSTAQELIAAVKSKRYPESGIRRMLLLAWLGSAVPAPGLRYIRVLGFNDRGRAALREIAKRCPVPLITKPASVRRLSEESQAAFEQSARAAALYGTLRPGDTRYNIWKETPVYRPGPQNEESEKA